MNSTFVLSKSPSLWEQARESAAYWTAPLLPSDSPLYASRANGCSLWDVDGNRYTDFLMSYGSVILGYADPAVNQAVIEQLEAGSIYSIDTPLRLELAKLLLQWFPNGEQVAFFKTGSEVTQAAIRLARLVTGKETVLHYGYHGWYDWCTQGDGVPLAVQDKLITFEYNDLDQIEQVLRSGEVAAVIMQPGGDHKKPAPGFLEGVRSLCTRHNTLLIFDEVRTGLRLAEGGAQGFFGVRPDLTAISKGLGNGLPISALIGPTSILEFLIKAQVEGTYHRDVLGIVAAITTLRELRQRVTVKHIWKVGQALMDGVRAISVRYPQVGLECKGFPPMPKISLDKNLPQHEQRKHRFYRELFRNGILFPPNHHLFLAGSHTQDSVETALEAVEGACKVLAK
jgi:glutamate-1-semialdehyde 2,1-aminomutase